MRSVHIPLPCGSLNAYRHLPCRASSNDTIDCGNYISTTTNHNPCSRCELILYNKLRIVRRHKFNTSTSYDNGLNLKTRNQIALCTRIPLHLYNGRFCALVRNHHLKCHLSRGILDGIWSNTCHIIRYDNSIRIIDRLLAAQFEKCSQIVIIYMSLGNRDIPRNLKSSFTQRTELL